MNCSFCNSTIDSAWCPTCGTMHGDSETGHRVPAFVARTQQVSEQIKAKGAFDGEVPNIMLAALVAIKEFVR